jgi:hypothetical protein
LEKSEALGSVPIIFIRRYIMELMYQMIVTCRPDSWKDVADDFMKTFGHFEATYYEGEGCAVVRSPYMNTNPLECDKASDLYILCDAVRNLANFGWPDYDPLKIVEIGNRDSQT